MSSVNTPVEAVEERNSGLVQKLLARPVQEVHDLTSAWKKFWFEPQDVATVALLRILAGGMILYTHIVWSLRLEEFFGTPGWQPADVVHVLREDASFWSFWWYVPESMLWPVHIACLIVLMMFFVGFLTPVTSKLAYLIVVSYAHRVPLANFGLDQINGFLALYLALSPCGRVASVDWILRRRREAKRALLRGQPPVYSQTAPSPWARLATRLIQIQLCVLYTYAGISKLKGDAWWDGNAIWMAAANLEYQSNSLIWMAWVRPLAEAVTHVTVLWECTFWATVWHPRIRPYTLWAGAMMHLGIGAFMGMWTFGLVMTFAYQSFTPPETVRAWGRWLWSLVSRPTEIRYVPAEAGFYSWRAAIDFNDDVTFSVDHDRLAAERDAWTRGRLPASWSEAASMCEAPGDPSVCHMLYVDFSAASQAHALPYFAKHGYDIRTARDWATARILRASGPCDVIVINVAPYSSEQITALEHELSADESVGVVVLAMPSQLDLWLRGGDVVLAGRSKLRDVRDAVASMGCQNQAEELSSGAEAAESDSLAHGELEPVETAEAFFSDDFNDEGFVHSPSVSGVWPEAAIDTSANYFESTEPHSRADLKSDAETEFEVSEEPSGKSSKTQRPETEPKSETEQKADPIDD